MTLAWLAELLGLPAGLHGHLEDTASTGLVTALAAARAAAPGRRVVVCSEHTHSSTAKAARLLELELRTTPVDDAYALCPDRLDLDGACARRGDRRHDVVGRGRPGRGARRALRRGGVWLHVDAAYAGSAAVCPELRDALRRLGARGLGRRQPAQVARHADGLLGLLHAPPRGAAGRVQPRPRVPSRRRGRRQPQRVQRAARPALSRAQALGGAALLRARGPAGGDPRARPAGGAVRGLGRATSRAGRSARRATSRSCASGATRRTRRTRRSSSASTPPARCSSPTRGWTAASCCGSRSGTRAPRRPTCAPLGPSLRREALLERPQEGEDAVGPVDDHVCRLDAGPVAPRRSRRRPGRRARARRARRTRRGPSCRRPA